MARLTTLETNTAFFVRYNMRRILMDRFKGDREQLAGFLGLKTNTLTKYLLGSCYPSEEAVNKMIMVSGLSREEFMQDPPENYNEYMWKAPKKKIKVRYTLVTAELREKIAQLEAENSRQKAEIKILRDKLGIADDSPSIAADDSEL